MGGVRWVDTLPGLTPINFYMKQILSHLKTHDLPRISSERSWIFCKGRNSRLTGLVENDPKEISVRDWKFFSARAVPADETVAMAMTFWLSFMGSNHFLSALLVSKGLFPEPSLKTHVAVSQGTTSPFQAGYCCLSESFSFKFPTQYLCLEKRQLRC